MPEGSGAIALHRRLSRCFDGYELRPYSPFYELFPPLLRRFARGKCDLIHTAPEHLVYLGRSDVPIVATLHGYNLDAAFRPWASWPQRLHYASDLRWSMRKGLERAERIVAVSSATAALARADLAIDREIQVIPNGVNLESFRPGPSVARDDRVRVLFAGNLSRRKGGHLLPAIAGALNENIDLVCAAGLRAGTGSPFRDSRIEWLGRVPPHQMPDLYRSVDMLLVPGVREGLSLAVIEAMASGLPVLASDASSFPEQVHHGKGGYLCEPGNSLAFATAINELAKAPELRQEMGRYNRWRAEQDYDEKRMAAAYAEVFESALGS